MFGVSELLQGYTGVKWGYIGSINGLYGLGLKV